MRLSARVLPLLCTATLATFGMILGGSPAAAQIVINEIDYDMVGTGDSAEFVELKNVSGGTVNLLGYTVELVNGNGGAAVYDTIVLPNVNLTAGDYFVICANAATVVNCDLDDGPDTDFIQNGSPDAVGLRLSGTLVDTVSYEGNTGAPYTEGTGTAAADSNTVAFVGLSRFADGVDSNNNNADLSLRCITPGVTNSAATSGCTAPPVPPNLSINDVSVSEGNAGTTIFTFTVSLAAPAPAGGVTFDIATADGTAQDGNPGTEDNDYVGQSLLTQSIAVGNTSYTFNVTVNGDAVIETNETFFVNVTNVVGTGVSVTDGQGQGTILTDDVALSFIHDVQGNGAATPVPGSTVAVEGVVIGDYQATTQLSGFFLEEEDADHDADPATSEGVFVFCNLCPTAVAEGQRVLVTGTVSEFFNATEITASTAGAVVVTNAGNNLAQVTPAPIDLPVVGVVNDFYEAREGMKVTFTDTLTVSEYFELARFGQIELYEGVRPRQFTEANTPSVAGYNAHLAALATRRVILDDDDNSQNVSLNDPNGLQFVYPPVANGGFSVGTQGVDFFRGGDLVNGLTGVLDWSFAGATGTDAWRIRPTAANPVAFTVANPRPATPPAVGGAIRAVGMNLLNYFTTIDTTSGGTGPCGPGGTLDCRGADSVAELNRQRARAALVICTLNADVYGFAELENTTPSAAITDLLGAVNASCGGAHPYTFANTGGTLGSDAIRVQQIYRTGILSPVGSPLSDLDPIHSRPPTAQTYDVVDATNPAFGQRFTVVMNHLKSKGSSAGLPGDADAGDGAGFSNATRTAQANRLLTWVTGTVVPAAGDPDVLLLGDFNAYAKEDPINALLAGGYNDLETTFHGANAYSYLFDGQLGHLDYAFASATLLGQVTSADAWHINADEADLFDYNDEIKDTGESAFEEKPDGSALVPPRVLFQPGTPYRASDHDPVVVGLFPVADLAITKTDGVTTATPGGSVTYTITASNAGPDPVPTATVADTFAATLTCTWTCVGAGGGTCTLAGAGNINDSANLPVGGSVTYTASCSISSSASGSLVNTATVAGNGVGDPNASNNSATDTDTLTPSANVGITKSDGAASEIPGTSVTYTIVAANAGPSAAPSVTIADTFVASLTGCSTTCLGAGGGTCTAGPVSGDIGDSAGLPVGASVTYTATCNIAATATGTLDNTATATVGGGVTDPAPGNNTATDSDTLTPSADVSITKTDGSLIAVPGTQVTYTIVVTNAGPSAASSVAVQDLFPAALSGCSTTCVGGGGGSCTAGPVAGNLNDTANLPLGGSATYTATCTVSLSATGTLANTATATVGGGGSDPSTGNNSATDTDTIDGMPFLDGFATGDTSRWTTSVPLTFEAYAALALTPGSPDASFDYDFAAVRAGEAFAPTAIAVATDAAGRPLYVVGARRLDANGPLELALEIVGGGRTPWLPAGEVGQRVRLEWSSAGQSDAGHVAVELDGRLAFWIEGYAGSATPAEVLLLRSPATLEP